MVHHQARFPLFGCVALSLKNQNKPVRPTLKSGKRPLQSELNKGKLGCKNTIQPPLKKNKPDLKELKSRSGGVYLKSSSAPVNFEAFFPDILSYLSRDVAQYPVIQTSANGLLNQLVNDEQISVDPTEEAVEKFLMQAKTKKAEDNREKDEVIVTNNVTKEENLELQPIKSDVKRMKVEKPQILPIPIPKCRKSLLDRDITALLKKIRSQVETELLNNSSVSNIQDVEKTIEEVEMQPRLKDMAIQTDATAEFPELPFLTQIPKE
ncbi:hypothetical protein PYW07_010225 [Mythimna separata]|uniref:Uncharacterized protein n=1 Tax=Mythimna separata TaxID=271217 RepID=A0AAD8DRI1_MYTSE|nr:hypothetical protein PYW07_010225 [Mythimna separata]